MATPALPIIVSPKTDSQLRQALWRLSQAIDALVEDITGTETDITQLQADVAQLQADVADLQTDVQEVRDLFIRTGTASGSVTAGDMLYPPANGQVSRAQANAAGTSIVIGVAINSALNGQPVDYYVAGVVDVTGVVVNTLYYLSADTPGAIVSTPDAVAGEYIVPVGRGTETGKLLFSPLTRILL